MKSPKEIAVEIVEEYYTIPECDSVPDNIVKDIQKAIQQERDRAKILEDALEFYASGQHMDADDYDTEIMDQLDFDLYEYWHGRYARQALAKYRGGE